MILTPLSSPEIKIKEIMKMNPLLFPFFDYLHRSVNYSGKH